MVKKSKDMANLFLAAKLVGGTGGGEQPVLITKNITENGIYSASADNADGYSQVTVDVPAPVPLSPTRSGATIYDYDGSVIATYTPEEFAALTEYPVHPTHEFLTGDGYNWPLADAQEYVAKYGYVEVGAQYRVTDGKTRLFIHLEEGRLEPQLGLGINGSVDVDWGDGSAHDTMTGSNVYNTVYQTHTYARAGNYIIALTVTGSVQFNGREGYGYILSKAGGNQNTNLVYLNALQSLYIGDSGVMTTYGNAFYNCCNLTSVIIPASIRNMSSQTFGSCYRLNSVILPFSEFVPSINASIVNYCYGLSLIVMPAQATSIGSKAFNNCTGITSVIIPDSVTSIDNMAFYNCYGLTSVIIPDSVTSIGGNAFSGCYGLGFIKFTSETPPTVSSISAWSSIPTDCIIYVPQGTLATYTSATNYPDPAKYNYVEY